MVELTSKRLKESYLNFIAIRSTLIYVQKESFRRYSDEFLRAIGFPYVGEITKERRSFVENKMDYMVQSMDELIILGFVSDFEKIIFDRLKNASGEIAKIVKEKYVAEPFQAFSVKFVKTSEDIDKLSIIKSMLTPPKLTDDLARKFAEIVDFRNRLAHGKRFGQQSLMTFDEIAQTLDSVLNQI